MGQRHQVFISTFNKENNTPEEITAFGTEEKTVYAYHNQWLFGVSAIENLHKVLTLASKAFKQKEYYNNIFDKKEFTVRTNKKLSKILENYMSLDESGTYSSYWLLNTPTETDESYMREEFDRGDNNDGVTIIDVVNRKYCFIGVETGPFTTHYTPMSAEEYVRSYYPVGEVEWADKAIPKILKKLNRYKVMTKEEVIAIFPKMEKAMNLETENA
jgi:hypothetical protein